MFLLSDIGGTHMRFALYEDGALQGLTVIRPARDESFESVLDTYLKTRHVTPSHMIFGVAGIVQNGRVRLTNRGDVLDEAVLKSKYHLQKCLIVNDFECQALGALCVPSNLLAPLGGGTIGEAQGPKCVIGPGTGLGVCFLVPQETGGYRPLASEAGHRALMYTTFSGVNTRAFYAALSRRFQHISAERVLSGSGFGYLYEALGDHEIPEMDEKRPESSQRDSVQISPEEIFERASAGEKRAQLAYQVFFELLGVFAADMALTLKTTGGVYLTGGILRQPIVRQWLEHSSFRARFEDKGRFTSFLKTVPTALILETQVAFLGLQELARRMHLEKK